MKHSDDLVIKILKDRYGRDLNWEIKAVSSRGASPFWQGLRPIFTSACKYFVAKLGNGNDFKFWLDEWFGRGALREEFPRLFALARSPNATTWECWDGAWSPTFNAALSDQRLEEFMIMQQRISNKWHHPTSHDGWEWEDVVFTVKSAYKKIREEQYEVDPLLAEACQFIWRLKVPLKVKIFGWFLLLGRLMTRVYHKRLYPDTMTTCGMCSSQDEDYKHLFFECPFARIVWNNQAINPVDVSSEAAFWDSIRRARLKKEEGRRIVAVLWTIWL